MGVSVPYPQEVVLEDGTRIPITDDDVEKRNLVVEIDKPETEVRRMLTGAGFQETSMEFIKDGQTGCGMVKRIGDWQVHIRLFRNGDRIHIDGEIEVSKAYVEHLTHGWIPALRQCADMLARCFGGGRIYHKRQRKYVKETLGERILSLPDPASKTSTVAVVVIGVGVVLIGAGIAWIWRESTKRKS